MYLRGTLNIFLKVSSLGYLYKIVISLYKPIGGIFKKKYISYFY